MKNIVIITHFKFWQLSQGAHVRIANQFSLFKDFTKYLIFLGKLSGSEKELIKEKFTVEKILCINSLKVNLIRILRKILSKIGLNKFYCLQKPFKYSYRLKNKARKFISENGIKVGLINYIWFSDILLNDKNKDIFKIIETHDPQFLFCEQNLKINFEWTSYIKQQDEFDILKKYDIVLSVSRIDKHYFDKELKNVYYLPSAVSLNYHNPHDTEIIKIGFVGGDTEFNFQAISWFITNVFNDLDESFELNIFGKVCERLSVYKNQRVKLRGYVDSFNEIYSLCDVMVNPAFIEGGIKTKNIECLGQGLPLLTTKAGALGLETGLEQGAFYSSNDPEVWKNILFDLKIYENREHCGKKAYEFAKVEFSKIKEIEFLNYLNKKMQN